MVKPVGVMKGAEAAGDGGVVGEGNSLSEPGERKSFGRGGVDVEISAGAIFGIGICFASVWPVLGVASSTPDGDDGILGRDAADLGDTEGSVINILFDAGVCVPFEIAVGRTHEAGGLGARVSYNCWELLDAAGAVVAARLPIAAAAAGCCIVLDVSRDPFQLGNKLAAAPLSASTLGL